MYRILSKIQIIYENLKKNSLYSYNVVINCIILVQEITNIDALCGRCGKKGMLTDNVTGERFCGKCGFVISETLQDFRTRMEIIFKRRRNRPNKNGCTNIH